jgi:hypothetical protein
MEGYKAAHEVWVEGFGLSGGHGEGGEEPGARISNCAAGSGNSTEKVLGVAAEAEPDMMNRGYRSVSPLR